MATNAPIEGRLVVIVLDRNIAYGKSAKIARELGAAIVDQLGPGDLASVVHTTHLTRSQNFTADRQRLLAAIHSQGVGNSLALGAGRAIGDCPCGLCSVDAVAHIARMLANSGPRQKTILFIGSGIATAIDPPGEMEIKTTTAAGDCIRDRWLASQAMFAAAQQGNVVVHTLDPSGLEGLPSKPREGEPSQAAGPGGQHVQLNPDSLRELASATGGRAVLNSK